MLSPLAASIVLSALAPIDVIYTEIPGHPTAQVPGLPGRQFTGMPSLYGSPNGANWIFKAFVDDVSDANDVIVVGSGTTGAAAAREGDPSPFPGIVYGFMDSDCGINDAGQYVFGNRLSGPDTQHDEIILKFDGTSIVSGVRESDVAPDLVDPDGAGNELFGNALNSAHILNDGTVAFHADLIQNINSGYRSACYHGADAVAQEGTTTGGTSVGQFTYGGFIALSGDTFSSDCCGESWIVEADVDPDPISSVQAIVVHGDDVVVEGSAIPGMASPVSEVYAVDMMGDGTWFGRGKNADDTGWILKDGALLVRTGDPILPASPETFSNAVIGATFLMMGSNASGLTIVAGGTDALDPNADVVLVAVGDRLLAREGDMVDLNQNGKDDDDAFIASFSPGDLVIDETGNVLLFVTLRDGEGTSLGDAFVRIPAETAGVPGDATGDGIVDFDDILAVLAAWGPCPAPCAADLDGNGTVDFADLLIVLSNFG